MTPLYDVIDSKQILWKDFCLAMSFGAKPHYAMRQIAPRHFFQSATGAGIGKDVVPSIIEELCGEMPAAVDRVTLCCVEDQQISLLAVEGPAVRCYKRAKKDIIRELSDSFSSKR